MRPGLNCKHHIKTEICNCKNSIELSMTNQNILQLWLKCCFQELIDCYGCMIKVMAKVEFSYTDIDKKDGYDAWSSLQTSDYNDFFYLRKVDNIASNNFWYKTISRANKVFLLQILTMTMRPGLNCKHQTRMIISTYGKLTTLPVTIFGTKPYQEQIKCFFCRY